MNLRATTMPAILAMSALSFAQHAAAQTPGGWTWSSQYSTVLGIGDTGDFAGGFSWRGATVDLEYAVGNDLTLGGAAGWHVLSEGAQGTRVLEQGSITGSAWSYVNAVPILFTGTWFMGPRDGSRTFLGAGAGTYWVENRIDAGTFTFEDSNWHLGLMAEAGALIPRSVGAIELSARFHWAMENSAPSRTYMTFSIGYVAGG
jgi:hypothetical protein